MVNLKFSEWLKLREGANSFASSINSSTTTAKNAGIYPELYTQYYNYPPAAVVNWSSDNITYMDPEDLVTRVTDNPLYAKIVRKIIGPYGKTGAGDAGD